MKYESQLAAFSSYLPARYEDNNELNNIFPEWSSDRISEKTGIFKRHIADQDEFTSDLAAQAAEKLFREQDFDRNAIDHLILVTQSPDFALPSTACIVHNSLGLQESSSAFDINLGCSGYVVALSVANALIASGQAENILLLTGDTYTRYLNPNDKSVRTIFGDGATATLIARANSGQKISSAVQGTDGSGARSLIVPNGGLRPAQTIAPLAVPEARALERSNYDLFMDGPAIFNFTLKVVGPTIDRLLDSESLSKDDIDLFVFHQANKFMLEHIIQKTQLPIEKCPVVMGDWGNTVSSTIPMALDSLHRSGKLRRGMKVALIGFGVGLSWAGVVVDF